jgi:hypothetical protein
VLINANTIMGNLAGAGDGGGISLYGVNGAELPNQAAENPNQNAAHRIDIVNNVIAYNVTGVAGGGIALQDAVSVRIVNNTIAHNDSTATGARALANPSLGVAQPGVGIAARTHGGPLAARIGGSARSLWGLNQQFHSNPLILNSIVFQNRMFHWLVTDPQNETGICTAGDGITPIPCYGLVSDGYSDLAVLGGNNHQLTANWSDLTSTTGVLGANNSVADPRFVAHYPNGPRDAIMQMPETTVPNLSVAAALDEGGNFIDTRFGPLTQNCPYAPSSGLLPYRDLRPTTLLTAPRYDPPGNPNDIAALGADILGTVRPTPTTVGAFQLAAPPAPQAACTTPNAAVAAN